MSAVLHMDEQTPHIHATLVPIVDGGTQTQEEGGTGEEAIPQETDRHSPIVCR